MNDADDGGPVVRVTNGLLLDMVRRRFDCMRVRTEGGLIERFESGEWRAIDDLPRVPVVEVLSRLRLMGDIDMDATCMVGASLRLLADRDAPGLTDFDVSFSRTESGAAIVVTRLEPKFGWHTNAALAGRAFGFVAQANRAQTRQEVRARAREAAEALPESDGQYAALLFAAGSACASAGAYDDAFALFERALPHALDVRLRVDIEHAIGTAHAENARFDEAIARYRAAIAAAETMPAPHIHAIPPLGALGEAFVELGDLAEAEKHIARAENLASTTFGATSAVAVLPRAARVVLERRRDAAFAEATATENLRAATAFDMGWHEELLRYELADLALSRGDATTATTHLRAISKNPSLTPQRARVYVLLARACRSRGSDAEALGALRSASALVTDALGPTHPLRIEVERELSQLTSSTPYR